MRGQKGVRWWRAVAVALAACVPALPGGAEGPPAPARVIPDRTILLLQQEITQITRGQSDAVVYGGARDLELLQQIAAATRTSAQAQIELLRQQNEIIRLLEALGQGPRPTR